MFCALCDVAVGDVEAHFGRHLGRFSLQVWRCAACPFRGPDLASFASHCIQTKHSTEGARAELDPDSAAAAFQLISRMQDALHRALSISTQTDESGPLDEPSHARPLPHHYDVAQEASIPTGRVWPKSISPLDSPAIELAHSGHWNASSPLQTSLLPCTSPRSDRNWSNSQSNRVKEDLEPWTKYGSYNESSEPEEYLAILESQNDLRPSVEDEYHDLESPSSHNDPMAADTISSAPKLPMTRKRIRAPSDDIGVPKTFRIRIRKEDWDFIVRERTPNPDKRRRFRGHRSWRPLFVKEIRDFNPHCALSASSRHLQIRESGDDGGAFAGSSVWCSYPDCRLVYTVSVSSEPNPRDANVWIDVVEKSVDYPCYQRLQS